MEEKCTTDYHQYFPLKENYYKLDKDGSFTGVGLPKYDQSIAYTMLCCRRCGVTKEVISADHRKEKKPEKEDFIR